MKTLRFKTEMYNTLLGSFLISLYITHSTDKKVWQLNKFYTQEKSRWLKNNVREDTWMEDIVKRLDKTITQTDTGRIITYPGHTTMPYGYIALVRGQHNTLVAPYVNGQIFPLREDAFMGPTLVTGTPTLITQDEGTVDGVEYSITDEEI